MKYWLYLDDERKPAKSAVYMHTRIGPDNIKYLETWVVAKNYNEFVKIIQERGLPEIISFDHDLAHEHYHMSMMDDHAYYNSLYDTFKEKTGRSAATWLVEYCIEHGKDLPTCYIHTMNPVGYENILSVLNSGKKVLASINN